MSQKTKYHYGVLLYVLCIVTILALFKNGISGNDYWWHIKVGEWIVQNKQVPQHDIFSWYQAGQLPWVPHEWLSEVIFYAIQHRFGEVGMYLCSIFAALLMTVLILWKCRIYLFKNIMISIVYFMGIIVLLPIFFYGRPHIFSYFLIFFHLHCLYSFIENENSKWVYWIPLLGLLWTNLHGGSASLSYILCLIFLICGALQFQMERLEAVRFTKRQMRILISITILTLLANFVNPSGVSGVLYPFISMSDSFMLSIIGEWTAPDAKELGQLLLYFFPIFTITISMILSKKTIRLHDGVLALVFLVLFLRSVRFVILYEIAALFFALPYMVPCKTKELMKGWEKGVVWIAIGGLVAWGTVSLKGIGQTINEGTMIRTVLEEEFIQLIQDENPKRILNDYDYGETLIYHDIPVFVDSRADLFCDTILPDAIALYTLHPRKTDDETEFSIETMIARYGFDAIVVKKQRALVPYLKSHPQQYRVMLESEETVYFKVIKN